MPFYPHNKIGRSPIERGILAICVLVFVALLLGLLGLKQINDVLTGRVSAHMEQCRADGFTTTECRQMLYSPVVIIHKKEQ